MLIAEIRMNPSTAIDLAAHFAQFAPLISIRSSLLPSNEHNPSESFDVHYE
jgi:hypothetical protein